MSSKVAFVSKTQHYLKVKKPLLERQRRARINKCLDAIKILVAEFKNDDAILRMDKAEMLEATILFMRDHQSLHSSAQNVHSTSATLATAQPSMDGFRNGYMNAVNEVSRVMAGMPGMSVEVGKSVMTHLGFEFNRMLKDESATRTSSMQPLTVLPAQCSAKNAPLSPASSGYHSDCDESSMTSPPIQQNTEQSIWRPW